jgi:hypothetical protein
MSTLPIPYDNRVFLIIYYWEIEQREVVMQYTS